MALVSEYISERVLNTAAACIGRDVSPVDNNWIVLLCTQSFMHIVVPTYNRQQKLRRIMLHFLTLVKKLEWYQKNYLTS